MSTLKLQEYLQELSQENPIIGLVESLSIAVADPVDPFLNQLQWLEENDRQSH